MPVAATSGRRTDYRWPEQLVHSYYLHFVEADAVKNGQSAEMPFAGFGIAVLRTI